MPKGRPASQHRPALGERIALARQAAGLTQHQLALALGVSQRVVTYWEREAVSVRADQLAKLAETLAVSVENLLGQNRKEAAQKPNDKTKQVLQRLQNLPANRRSPLLKAVEKLVSEAERTASP